MDKKYFEEFMGIFGHIRYAASIISGDFYTPGVNQEIEKIEHFLDQFAKWDSALSRNVLDEIEQNLYNHPDSREIYLTKILKAFLPIAPYLNIDVVT